MRKLFILAALFFFTVKTLDCPFEPIQLLRPDPQNPNNLQIIEESLWQLGNISSPIVAITLVGPMKMGKSYLGNQLVGCTKGFKIGPTISAETLGLWMSPPQNYSGRDDVVFVFFDSEGLFSAQVNHDYDAKIFAISSLLSSYLIYNTNRAIDKFSIDYIELMTKRAELFGIRSQMEHLSDVESVHLPPLLWVVQNFFQDTDGQTKKQWLQSLIQESSHSLSNLFESIDCATLPIPANSEALLRNLDKVEQTSLKPDYQKEIKELREKIYKEAPIKKRSKKPLLANELVEFIRAIVRSSNGEAFPEVPSRWDMFINETFTTARIEVMKSYNLLFNHALVHENVVNSVDFNKIASRVKNLATAEFSQRTLNLKTEEKLSEEFQNSFVDALNNRESEYRESNQRNIRETCESVGKELQNQIVGFFGRMKLPISHGELEKHGQEQKSLAEYSYGEKLKNFQNEEAYKQEFKDLQTRLSGILAEVTLKNTEEIKKIHEEAVSRGVKQLSHYLKKYEGKAQKVKQIETIRIESLDDARGTWVQVMDWTINENGALVSQLNLEEKHKIAIESLIKKNRELSKKLIDPTLRTIEEVLDSQISKITIPKSVSVIRKDLERLNNSIIQEWNQNVTNYFPDSASDITEPELFKATQKLQKMLYEASQKLMDKNLGVFTRANKAALENAKKASVKYLNETFFLDIATYRSAMKGVLVVLLEKENVTDGETQNEITEKFVNDQLDRYVAGIQISGSDGFLWILPSLIFKLANNLIRLFK